MIGWRGYWNATSRNEEVGLRATNLRWQGPKFEPDRFTHVYRTDRASWVVQGWLVTDPEALAQMNIPDGEGCVEVPDRLVQFFR